MDDGIKSQYDELIPIRALALIFVACGVLLAIMLVGFIEPSFPFIFTVLIIMLLTSLGIDYFVTMNHTVKLISASSYGTVELLSALSLLHFPEKSSAINEN